MGKKETYTAEWRERIKDRIANKLEELKEIEKEKKLKEQSYKEQQRQWQMEECERKRKRDEMEKEDAKIKRQRIVEDIIHLSDDSFFWWLWED